MKTPHLLLALPLLLAACQAARLDTEGEDEDLVDPLVQAGNAHCGPVSPEMAARVVYTPGFGLKVYTNGFDVVQHPDPACRLEVASIDRGIQRALDRWVGRGYDLGGLLNAVSRVTEIHIMEDLPPEGIAATRISWSGGQDNFRATMHMPLNPIYPGTSSPYPVFCNVMGHELDHLFAFGVRRDIYQVVGHSTDISGNPYPEGELAGGIPAYGTWCEAAPPSVLVTISGQVVDLNGRGISRVSLSLHGSGGDFLSSTSSFGYFSFHGVPSGHAYTLVARAKRYAIDPVELDVTGEVTGLVLTGAISF